MQFVDFSQLEQLWKDKKQKIEKKKSGRRNNNNIKKLFTIYMNSIKFF